MFKTVIQDVLFGLRMLRKNPGFTFVAVLTLALCIGANSTVFTLVNTVLFKGLPYPDSDRIVAITSTNLAKNQPEIWAAYRTAIRSAKPPWDPLSSRGGPA